MGNVTVAYDTPGRAPSFGSKRIMTGTITLSSSYATGGDTILAGDRRFGLPLSLDRVFIFPNKSIASSPFHLFFDSDTAPTKVLAEGHVHTENTAAAYTQFATTLGALSNAGAIQAPLEVTSTTNLSTVVCAFMAIGL